MSIIERVAELLGPLGRLNPGSSTPGEMEGPELGLVERTVSESSERSKLTGARELAAQPQAKGLAAESKAKARPARFSVTTRTLRIDQIGRAHV